MKNYIIERAALIENIRIVRQQAGQANIWAVLKGNAYGLGLLPLASLLREQGIARFAVAELGEALELRRNGFAQEPILMLRPLHEAEELTQLLEYNITATISSPANAQALESVAAQLERSGQAHLKFDTGMGRYGFLPEEISQIPTVLDSLQHIAITGAYTHFSCAFCSRQKTEAQYRLFRSMIDTLTAQGYRLGETHCANSSALFRYPQLQADSVRIGSAFLGRLPFAHHTALQRVGYAEASVEEIRQLPAGATIGYGASYRTQKPTTIAVLSIGWYHGFGMERGRDSFRLRDTLRNSLSLIKAWLSRRRVYVRLLDKQCPVLGHVGMLHTIVDVSGLNVQVGDIARVEISPLDCKALPIVYR